MIPKVLTIAGSDASGGAGQLADLKTFQEYGVFGSVVLTCIVTMDPDNNWAPAINSIDIELIDQQLKTNLAGTPFDAVKTGMIDSVEKIQFIGKVLSQQDIPNIVVDPVMVCKASQGMELEDMAQAMIQNLLPLATVTTPNLVEAEVLAEMSINSVDDMVQAAKIIHSFGPKNVVIKGGNRLEGNTAVDVFYDGETVHILENDKLTTNNNHGAGCTFAAAITAGLAKGYDPLTATKLAKNFVYEAIRHGFHVNPTTGHTWTGAYNTAQNRMKVGKMNA